MKLFKPAPEAISVETSSGENVEAKFYEPATVLEVLLHNEIDVATSCGGMGTCGTCRVVVTDGLKDLEGRNEIELEIAEARSFKDCERLACQIPAMKGLRIRVP